MGGSEKAQQRVIDALWETPVSKIMNGLAYNSRVTPERPIWELVQNARDVSHENGKAHIRFILRPDEFVFEHDGQPFTEDALNGLILQTSNKVRQDIVKVGQYGTGFITTHLFGRIFVVEGSMRMVEGEPPYHNFDNLLIDRSSDDTLSLKHALQQQTNVVVSWSEEGQSRVSTPQKWTRFRYKQKVSQEGENVRIAFKEAPALVPYVLALNSKYISCIDFVDDTSRQDESFVLSSVVEDEHPYGDAIRTIYTIQHTKTGCAIENIVIWTLTSQSEREEKTGDSKVTVILPVKQTAEHIVELFELDDKTPRQFLFFPLLGTCDWGWNYIIHSPLFTCDTDSRDKLLLLSDGYDSNNSKVDSNKNVIALAGKLIRNYLDENRNGELNPHYWARVSFPMSDEKVRVYFEGLQREWVSFFFQKPIVRHGDTWLKPMYIHVLDHELRLACEKDSELLQPLHAFLMHQYGDNTVEIDDLLYWSRITEEWYKTEDNNPLALGIKEIAAQIDKIELVETDLDWLLPIAKYINEHHSSLLDEYAILPNESLERNVRDNLVCPILFDKDLRKVMNVLISEEVKRFIHPRFAGAIQLTTFDKKDAWEKLSISIKNLPKEVERLKLTLTNENDCRSHCIQSILKEDVRWVILALYKMSTPNAATGVYKQALDLIEEYYGVCTITQIKLDTEIFDNRICYTALINDVLLQFALLDVETQSEYADWMNRLVKALYTTADTQSVLRVYPVYPNQMGKFTYGSKLEKEVGFFTPELKDYYNTMCNPQEGNVRVNLLSAEYADCFVETATCDAQKLAAAIQKPFVEANNYNIKDHVHEATLLEIIQKLGEPEWALLFSDFNAHKADMMMSIMEGEKKNSLFRLMSIKDKEKLRQIAALADEDNIERILKLGQEAFDKERRDDMDWEHKKALGLFVERSLQQKLNMVLGEHAIKVPEPVKDEQNGQDLIVYLDDSPIYYVEVKSRWSTDRSVLMSTNQHKRSVEKQECYALCAADMVGYEQLYAVNNETATGDKLEELLKRIKVLTDIGEKNSYMSDAVDDVDKTKTHIAGGYQVLVPQEVLKDGVSFDELIKVIEAKIREKL